MARASDRVVRAEDVEVEVGGGQYGHTGGAVFGTDAAAAEPARALSSGSVVTRLLRSARFVPLSTLKHAAEAFPRPGERVMEAVVIFADVSGKATLVVQPIDV